MFLQALTFLEKEDWSTLFSSNVHKSRHRKQTASHDNKQCCKGEMHTVHHAAINIVKPELRSVTARALVLLCIGNREITENELISGTWKREKLHV